MTKEYRKIDIQLMLETMGLRLKAKGVQCVYTYDHRRIIQSVFAVITTGFGRKAIDLKEFKKLALHLHLEKEQLEDFLDGNMAKKDYFQILIDKGVIEAVN